jgi:hypothetical protein
MTQGDVVSHYYLTNLILMEISEGGGQPNPFLHGYYLCVVHEFWL